MDLESVARELYRLPPAQFTAARNARARELVSGGDRPLANEVRSLARPSAAAWAVNRVHDDEPELAAQVAQLGETLREALEHPDRRTLTDLGEQRKSLVRRATSRAAELAEQSDVSLSDAARTEVEQTFFAAVADARAAAAAFSGRLIRSLQSTGFEEVDLSAAIGGPEAAPLEPSAAGSVKVEPAASDAAEAAKAAERKRSHDDAVRAATEARQAADEAHQRAEDLADTLGGYDREARDVAAEIDDLEAQLEELHDRQRDLATQQRTAEREHRDAVVAARRAARAADDAESHAADLA